MGTKHINTEEVILKAAEEVFIQKGSDGARMQEIADRAGINKSLLHYYYRTKDKLFDTVFKAAFALFVPRIQKAINEQTDLFEFIEMFVGSYIELLGKNQFIPGFVMSEMRRNPNRVVNLFSETIGNERLNLFSKIQTIINKQVEEGVIIPIEPITLMVNMVSLCIFPVLAKPIITGIFLNKDNSKYEQFMQNRNKAIVEFVINAIKI